MIEVLNSPNKPTQPLSQVLETASRQLKQEVGKLQHLAQDLPQNIAAGVTPVIMKAQEQEALQKSKPQSPLIESNDFQPIDVKLPEANTKQFEFDLNTFNVTSKTDLERLSDRLFEEHYTAKQKNRKETAAILERTINTIEIHNAVPEFAYRPLAQLGIRLVKPE